MDTKHKIMGLHYMHRRGEEKVNLSTNYEGRKHHSSIVMRRSAVCLLVYVSIDFVGISDEILSGFSGHQ